MSWKQLKMDGKGQYININEQDGRIVYCKRHSNMLPTPSKTSVAQVRYMLFKGQQIDDWFLKVFRKWENEFAKNNIDKYNELINLPF